MHLTCEDFNNIFYGYAIIYIVQQIILLTKKDRIPADFEGFDFDSNNPIESVQKNVERANQIRQKEKNKKKTFIDRFDSLLSWLSVIWMIAGLWTPEVYMFVALITVFIVNIIYMSYRMLTSYNKQDMVKIFNAASLFEIAVALLVLFHHFFYN